jgi:hypothetical protein
MLVGSSSGRRVNGLVISVLQSGKGAIGGCQDVNTTLPSYWVPTVRIHLPPAKNQERTCLVAISLRTVRPGSCWTGPALSAAGGRRSRLTEPLFLAKRQNGILQCGQTGEPHGHGRGIETAELPGQRRDTPAVTVCVPRDPDEPRLSVHPRGAGEAIIAIPAHYRGNPIGRKRDGRTLVCAADGTGPDQFRTLLAPHAA